MADATPATNATNHTRYFNLPLFISTDRPSWLVDWNGAMGEIDTILNDIATTSEGASSAVSTIQTQIDTLSATVTSLNSIVDTAVADVASMQTTVDAVETRLDNVESDLITQNNLIKTLSDTVVAMQATVSTLDNHVNTLNDAVTAMGVNVSAIQTALNGVTSDVSALQSSVASINSSLSNLDSRVTALENAPSTGGGLITVEDLQDTSKFQKITIYDGGVSTAQSGTTFSESFSYPDYECYIMGVLQVTDETADNGIFASVRNYPYPLVLTTTDFEISRGGGTSSGMGTTKIPLPLVHTTGNIASNGSFFAEYDGSGNFGSNLYAHATIVAYKPI